MGVKKGVGGNDMLGGKGRRYPRNAEDAPKGERVCQKGRGVGESRRGGRRGRNTLRGENTPGGQWSCLRAWGRTTPPPQSPSMGVGLRGIVRCVRDRAAYTVGKGRWERDGHEGVNKRGRGRSVRGRGQARGACPTSGKAVGRGRRQSERRLADGR